MSDNDAIFVATRVVQGLHRLGLEYVIGGSFASSAWGQFRPTRDLDMALEIKVSDIDQFLVEFGDEFVVSRGEIESAINSGETYASFQLLHFDRMFKVDVFLMDGSDFARSEMSRRLPINLFPDLPTYVATAEDIVLQKLRWYELGNRVSDRQWNDIVQVIQVQGSAFDRAYVREWAAKLELLGLAEEAFSEAVPIEP